MSETPPGTPASPAPEESAESLDSAILRLLMENLPDRIYFKDVQSRFVRVNRAHAHWLGAAGPDEVIGKTDFDFFSQAHAQGAFTEEQVIMYTGRPMVGEVQRITKRDGTEAWGSTTKMPWRDGHGRIIGTFGVTRNVTATKQAEDKLSQERNLLRTIIDHLPSRIFVKDTSFHYLINNQAHLRLLGLEHQDEARGRTTLDFFPGERGQQAIADDRKVIESGEPILNQEKSDFGAGDQTRWALTTRVPFLDVRGKVIGIVGISHDITERKRMQQELQQRTEEMEADVRMARQIQEAFFSQAYPIFPRGVAAEASTLRFAHRYVPASTLGGDFFDIVRLSDTRCGILVCDVMGHGVRAGLLTALIRGVVEEVGPHARDAAQVLGEINRALMPIVHQTGQPVFATAFYAVIDTTVRTLSFGNAGHPPPLVLRAATGVVDQLSLDDPEPATGLIEGFEYTSHECVFAPGDVFLGYTDGLFEAGDATGNQFGEERLRAFLAAHVGTPGAELLKKLESEIVAFTGHAHFDDDICALTVEAAKVAPPTA
ncbi:MAG: SpoIIE family protein phosphatase [Verrucomicrobia bacterium]|nr:SpoIIE family protein phosphatase [Verrucomicrobiota bacterium]